MKHLLIFCLLMFVGIAYFRARSIQHDVKWLASHSYAKWGFTK